jgi:hypothetical protein
VVVFQLVRYGDVVTIPPSGWPSTRNCTPVVVAVLAVICKLPETVAPSNGAMRVMFGGAGNTGVTVCSTCTV